MLIASDLHLTNLSRDSYRWDLFPWLWSLLRKNEYKNESVYILGDLTDSKDGHDSALVNRILGALSSLECPVHILQGNHDYIDDKQAFFSFLSGDTYSDKIHWYSEVGVSEPGVLMVPHSRAPSEDWKSLEIPGGTHTIFCHQTFNGANAGQFILPSSVGPRYFNEALGYEGTVISGDVHVPQRLPKNGHGVTYVGSPYPVSFSDSFTPRILHAKDGEILSSIEVPTIRRHSLSVECADDLEAMVDLASGDQVKLKVMLPRSEFHNWDTHKNSILEWCAKNEVGVFAVELREQNKKTRKGERLAKKQEFRSDTEMLDMFGRGLPDEILDIGRNLLNDSLKGGS